MLVYFRPIAQQVRGYWLHLVRHCRCKRRGFPPWQYQVRDMDLRLDDHGHVRGYCPGTQYDFGILCPAAAREWYRLHGIEGEPPKVR